MRNHHLLTSLLFLVCSVAVLAGCSTIVAIPSAVPPLTEYTNMSLTGIELTLINDEQDSSDLVILHSRRIGKFTGNRKQWSDNFVAALSRELTSRGAVVKDNAPVKISFTMPEITGKAGYQGIRFNSKVIAAFDSGWSKAYEGSANVSVWGALGFLDGKARKASSYTLMEVMKAMLGDDEFLIQLKRK